VSPLRNTSFVTFYCGSTLNLLYKPLLLLVVYLLEVSFSNALTGTLHIYLRLELQTLVKIVITTCIAYPSRIRTNQFDWVHVKGLIMCIYSYFTHTALQQAPQQHLRNLLFSLGDNNAGSTNSLRCAWLVRMRLSELCGPTFGLDYLAKGEPNILFI